MMILSDSWGRIFKYLRVSVTDRCNYKCKYCCPHDSFEHIHHNKILRYEDILFVVMVLTKYGLKKVRITGGEPLVRKGLVEFIKELNNVPGIEEITITTNGSLLDIYGLKLKEAGIKRINISLDSLQADKYSFITGGFELDKIIRNINFAKALGFDPIKINTVIINGFNNNEILDFCEFAYHTGTIVRFIEFMPVGNIGWSYEKVYSSDNILKVISTKYKFTHINKSDGPSRNYKLSNGATIGIISPITHHFCKTCDKLRLMANGSIRPCLLMNNEIDLFDIIKKKDESEFIQNLIEAFKLKNKEHNLIKEDTPKNNGKPMSSIGG